MRRTGPDRTRSRSGPSPILSAEQLRELSSHDPAARERAWTAFYPRARAIAASKLRNHFGLRPGLDDQDADDAVDAAIGILYRRCLHAPADNPVRQPYALLVSISVHLLPKHWKQRKRQREVNERVARLYPESFESTHDDFRGPRPNAHAENLARWLVLQLDKALPAMPKEIKAGLLGTLFRDAGLSLVLDETLDALPEARRRHCRLFHDNGFSTSQIAEHCGCGPSNVSNSLRRCWAAFNASPGFRQALDLIAEGQVGPATMALPSSLAPSSTPVAS